MKDKKNTTEELRTISEMYGKIFKESRKEVLRVVKLKNEKRAAIS